MPYLNPSASSNPTIISKNVDPRREHRRLQHQGQHTSHSERMADRKRPRNVRQAGGVPALTFPE